MPLLTQYTYIRRAITNASAPTQPSPGPTVYRRIAAKPGLPPELFGCPESGSRTLLSSTYTPSTQQSPTVPLQISEQLAPLECSPFHRPYHLSYLSATSPPHQAPLNVHQCNTRPDTCVVPAVVQPLPLPISKLSQELVNAILDQVAYTRDRDKFPVIPQGDLVSCSLTCRKWLARSSYHLLRRLHFEAPGDFSTQEDSEKVYGRLEQLMIASRTSCRLMAYITGLPVLWSGGMPSLVLLVDNIKLAFPRLSILRFDGSP
ncbi:uncharacterized protein PHACADRAFT_31200 [Phanerochaete carnosa HHB-10118-sp]|uniref:F-box domain-containing protein n=1 Tax=Phanerochaete carnosa (strain HHB-10118-sp) TaxID=650164 RepID=K5VMP6_PHACS|nr:uncharacterized protein PHACADRAFT_31200 [Phanerochaete carnosa HHB-10118-sp]EKM52733.1 hypothetical protein PHACADRAFT_31200 [Phanerochaete carnosa HHB-10118-sp]